MDASSASRICSVSYPRGARCGNQLATTICAGFTARIWQISFDSQRRQTLMPGPKLRAVPACRSPLLLRAEETLRRSCQLLVVHSNRNPRSKTQPNVRSFPCEVDQAALRRRLPRPMPIIPTPRRAKETGSGTLTLLELNAPTFPVGSKGAPCSTPNSNWEPSECGKQFPKLLCRGLTRSC
jgi:hypothetical protein